MLSFVTTNLSARTKTRNKPISIVAVKLVDGFLESKTNDSANKRFAIRKIRSINLSHEFTEAGYSDSIDVYVNSAIKPPSHSLGGRSTKKIYLGTIDTNSSEAKFFRTTISNAGIPVIEL